MITRLFSNRLALLGVCLAAAAAVYLNALANGFALDDVYIIQQNARVHDLSAWREIWLTPYWQFFGVELGLWRPFAIYGYALQWAVGDGAAWPFHLTSILLHVTVTALAFLLLEKLTALIPAFVGALLFAVHPLHTEAVANIVGQAELITAAALVGACVVHAYRPEGLAVSWPRRVVLLLLFLIGVAAKENAVVMPALLVITDFAQHRARLTLRGLADYADALLMPFLLLAAGLAFYLVFRFEVLGGQLIGTDAGPTLPFLREEFRVLNALRAFPEFLRLLFFPQDLAADYSPAMLLPVESLTPMAIVGAVLLAAIVVLALIAPWKPAAGFPAAWFLITIVTVSNLFFPIGVLVAERTLYLPSFAFCALVAYAWLAAAPRASLLSRRLAPGLLAVAVIALGVRTWVRNPDWKSTPAVLFSMIRDHPESYRAQWVHATWQWQRGETAVARTHFELAYRIYPRDSQFLAEYANFLLTDGQTERATEMLEQSYAMHDYIPRTATLLAYAYINGGRHADALRMAKRAQQLGADAFNTLPLMAYAHEGLGDRDAAIAAWRVTLSRPRLGNWVTHSFLARTLATRGFDDEARTALDNARRIAPDSAAHATIDRVAAAVRSGCYRAEPSAAPATGGLPQRPADSAECDPLVGLSNAAPQVQNASPLHNARPAVPPPPGATAGDVR